MQGLRKSKEVGLDGVDPSKGRRGGNEVGRVSRARLRTPDHIQSVQGTYWRILSRGVT